MASDKDQYRADEAEGQAEEKTGGMTHAMREKATEAKDKTHETTQQAKEKAAHEAQEDKEKAAETAEATKQKTCEGKEKTKGVLQQSGEKVKQMAEGAADAVKHTLGVGGQRSEDYDTTTGTGHKHDDPTPKETK